ncbi:MAG: AEC family transporter [Prevotella sp.]|nr:AEC family transporter [Prevotella sp.]
MSNIEVMVVLFAIVVVGFVAGKRGYMGGEFDRRLSSLVIDITCPALILSSTMGGTLPDRRLILPLLVISLITYVLLALAAVTLPRLLTKKEDDRGVVGFALMFGNVGFIGYPIVASIFGHEAVFYAAVLNVVNTFAVFTVGTMLLTSRNQGLPHSRRGWVKLLLSTPMLAAYLAMLIVSLNIDNIPAVVSQPLTLIGNITVPAALLIIGSSMSRLSLRTMMGSPTVYATTLFRLILLPLALLVLFRLLDFDMLAVNINTVVIAMPVATYGTILCLKMGRDATLITELTFISTLISIITIPLMAMLLNV